MATNYFTVQADVPENALYSLLVGLEKAGAINIVTRPADWQVPDAGSRRQVPQRPSTGGSSQDGLLLKRDPRRSSLEKLKSERAHNTRPAGASRLHKNAPKGNYDVRAAVNDANLWMASQLVTAHQSKEPIRRADFSAEMHAKYPDLRVTNYFNRWETQGVIARHPDGVRGDGKYAPGPNAEDFLKKIRG